MRAALMIVFACGALSAQTAAPPHFEVASVKPDGPIFRPGPGNITGGPGSENPTRINYNFATLRFLLMQAYSVLDVQVSGPDWIDDDRYTITANVPPGATKQQVSEMLQSLLSERFGLTIHHESKVMPIYELTVATGGSKLQVSPDDAQPAPAGDPGAGVKYVDGVPQFPPGSIGMLESGRVIVAAHQPISALTRNLPAYIRTDPSDKRPVIDKTGLTGFYDFTLKLTPAFALLNPATAADPSLGPDVFTALREQLGLRLEDKKAPLDVIVIDHAEQTQQRINPSKNKTGTAHF